MKPDRAQSLIAMLIGVSLASVGQLLLKQGTAVMGALELDGGLASRLLSTVFRPQVLGGLALYAVSTMFYLFALSREDLSFVYPLIALNFVLVAILSRIVLNEVLSPMRITGIFIVMVGVVLLAGKG